MNEAEDKVAAFINPVLLPY